MCVNVPTALARCAPATATLTSAQPLPKGYLAQALNELDLAEPVPAIARAAAPAARAFGAGTRHDFGAGMRLGSATGAPREGVI